MAYHHKYKNRPVIQGVIVECVKDAVLVEDYPNYPKGASILVLQRDDYGSMISEIWYMWSGEYQKDTVPPLFW